jgi:hypothetical protein
MSELNEIRCLSLSQRVGKGMASAVSIVCLLVLAVTVFGVCANLLDCTVVAEVRSVGGCNESLRCGRLKD